MSFAPPKVEEKETNIKKPIIPSLKLDEIKDEKDLDQEGKIEGKTNVQQEENNITEKTQQELSSKIDETLNDNDTIITAKDTESPIKKTTFHMPNQTARKKIAAAGRKKYFRLFNELNIAKYIIDKSLGKRSSLY